MDEPVILAVDDDPQVLRQIGRDPIKQDGEHYSVRRADSGQQGLEAFDELAGRAAPVALLPESSVPGVFAAGGERHGPLERVASAAGEGSVAVHFVHRHLMSR